MVQGDLGSGNVVLKPREGEKPEEKATSCQRSTNHKGVSTNRGTPKSSIFIGFSIIFTIHFGGFPISCLFF